MNEWFKILNMVTQAMMISEDGKIDEQEEDQIANMVAPYLADLYNEEDLPYEKWNVVSLLVKIAQKTIELIEEKE